VQTQPSHVPAAEIVHHTAKAATPIPVGTPSVPLERAFGPEYKAFAVARLDGAAFRCLPSEYKYRSLEQPQLDWTWNCLPTCPGDHSVDVHIYVQWEPIGEGDILEREVWRSRLEIPVTEPWIERDHLGVLSLVSGVFGSALSVPWLYERIREAGERRRKKEESKPKLYIARK
jgi:hypothetical protein